VIGDHPDRRRQQQDGGCAVPKLDEWETEPYGDITVYYTHELDGGGRTYGQEFVPFLREWIGPVESALEWCAGPGFIGFSMLGEGLCETLSLADINSKAIEAAATTVSQNALDTQVRLYVSDCLESLPVDSRFDVVVANPPHSGTDEVIARIGRPPILYMDPEWSIHRRFYEQVGSFLRPGGSVVLQENSLFSSVSDFEEMVDAAGLEWVGSVQGERGYYFVWSRLPE
jgi:methylase of polypeptide subunit release factors